MKKGILALVGMLIMFSMITPMRADAAGTLAWNASTGVVQGYKVYYGTTSGGPYPNSANAGTATSYVMNNMPLQEGATYYFVVRAYNQAGESTNSNQISHTVTDSTPPAPPQRGQRKLDSSPGGLRKRLHPTGINKKASGLRRRAPRQGDHPSLSCTI